jgi:hypothetical protein
MSSISIPVIAVTPPIPQSSDSFFLKAAISGAVCSTISAALNGFDVTKIRMQNQPATNRKYTGLIPGMKVIYREEGFAGLAKGIHASMLREVTYSSLRIGGYEPIRKFLSTTLAGKSVENNAETNPLIKYLAALITGGGASAVCNPFDFAKTTFQAELPPGTVGATPLKYQTTWAFFQGTVREHGFGGLYKGWAATSARAAVLTSAQLGSYDTIKNNVLKKWFGLSEGFAMHLSVSMTVGLITTTAANPCKLY